ncbi:MAG: FG-GAP-like repeat-containing protein [Myxococcales bacterium]|nr:FG-GAP-like repeat-containing protein [Myxococcales bacterium]
MNTNKLPFVSAILFFAGVGCVADLEGGLEEEQKIATTSQALTDDGSFFPINSNMSCANLDCDTFAPARDGSIVKRTRGSNSQTQLPGNVIFGDFNGDRAADYLVFSGNRVFVTNADYYKRGMAHAFSNKTIERAFVGDFYGAGWDQVCLYAQGDLECLGIDPSQGTQFQHWFTQRLSLSADDDVVVGDYDGDGRDEWFVYRKTAGTFRMLEVVGDKDFVNKADWSPANLTRVAAPGIRFRAGDYHGDGRTDLVAINQSGRILVFKSALYRGETHFWWSFTSVSNFVTADEDLVLARVDDNLADDLVIHDREAGNVRFHKVSYNSGTPPRLGISTGQIRIRKNSLLTMNYSHGYRNEPGSELRDDAFVYDRSQRFIYKSSARWSETNQNYTYWWAHQHAAPSASGWPTVAKKKVLFLKCKFSDSEDIPFDDQFYVDLTGRIVDYFAEVTYGGLDLSDSVLVPQWIQMDLTAASKPPRRTTGEECASKAGGIAGYDAVFSFQNAWSDWGASSPYANVKPSRSDVWVSVQELAHVTGWGPGHPRAEDGSTYGDAWDVSSGQTRGHTYTNWLGVDEGPGMIVYNRSRLGYVSSSRIHTIRFGSSKTARYLAALTHPEAAGDLEVRVENAAGNYYTLEYREKYGYDSGIPRNTVLVHEIKNGSSYLISSDNGPERLAGQSYTLPDGVVVRVTSVSTSHHRARVEVSYP